MSIKYTYYAKCLTGGHAGCLHNNTAICVFELYMRMHTNTHRNLKLHYTNIKKNTQACRDIDLYKSSKNAK